jgi:hypothetical protein
LLFRGRVQQCPRVPCSSQSKSSVSPCAVVGCVHANLQNLRSLF